MSFALGGPVFSYQSAIPRLLRLKSKLLKSKLLKPIMRSAAHPYLNFGERGAENSNHCCFAKTGANSVANNCVHCAHHQDA